MTRRTIGAFHATRTLAVLADRLRSRREPDHDWLVHGVKVLTKRSRTKGQGSEARSFLTPHPPPVLIV